MPVQRDIWKRRFIALPSFPCPSCSVGVLKLNKEKVFSEETAFSKSAHHHEAWEPEWIEKRFSGMLECANPTCRDSITFCGSIETRLNAFHDPHDGWTETVDEYYVPNYFEPPLQFFPIPDECPEEIHAELEKAFALFWLDVGASANRLRVAVESLLNEQRVQKKAQIRTGSRRGKYQALSLHQRIEKLENEKQEAATQLMALKWLGNAGSHATLQRLKSDDLLDAFEHFEYALDLIYVRRGTALEKRAKAIIRKKGPLKKRRRSKK